jgi:hypothetical protein
MRHQSLRFKSCSIKGSREFGSRRTESSDAGARADAVLGTNRSGLSTFGADATSLRTAAESFI